MKGHELHQQTRKKWSEEVWDVCHPDGDLEVASVTVLTNTTNGTVQCNDVGECLYTPDADFHGVDTFVYEVCDWQPVCDEATVTITIESAPDPPVAEDDSAMTIADVPVDIPVVDNDSDPDGDLSVTSVTIVTEPSNGSVECNDACVCTYTPDEGYDGDDSFVYKMCDTQPVCDQATAPDFGSNQRPYKQPDFRTN